jgi:hypothetical protein
VTNDPLTPFLSLQQAPEFAVDTRMRPSHYKPQEERELDQIASHPAFKARPVEYAPAPHNHLLSYLIPYPRHAGCSTAENRSAAVLA